MRDDVKALFDDLLKHLDLKTILLNSFLESEKSASDLIKYRNDAEDDILKIIENESRLIDEINLEDYNISQIKDLIIRKYSFDFDRIFKDGFNTSEPEIIDYKNKIIQQKKIIEYILILKKRNNLSMDNTQADLQTQISELERMSKFKIVFPKDLQSF